MGKKWKRLLVQRRKQQATSAPVSAPVVSNSEMIERMEAVQAIPEPEVVEEAQEEEVLVAEPEAVEEEQVVEEKPKPTRRRRKKSKSED